MLQLRKQGIKKIQEKISKTKVPGKFRKTNRISKNKVLRKSCIAIRI